MMHSKFFKQIYTNELNANFSSIERRKASMDINRIVEKRIENNNGFTNTELETLLERSRRNPNLKLNANEAALLDKEKELLDKEVDTVLGEIHNLRESISKEVLTSTDSYILKLNENQQSSTIEVFGERKTEITYEDYMTLLELKKLLDVDETFDLLTEAT